MAHPGFVFGLDSNTDVTLCDVSDNVATGKIMSMGIHPDGTLMIIVLVMDESGDQSFRTFSLSFKVSDQALDDMTKVAILSAIICVTPPEG